MKKLLLTLLMLAVVAPSIYAKEGKKGCGCGCEKKEKKATKKCEIKRCDGEVAKERCTSEEKKDETDKTKKAKKTAKKAKAAKMENEK